MQFTNQNESVKGIIFVYKILALFLITENYSGVLLTFKFQCDIIVIK